MVKRQYVLVLGIGLLLVTGLTVGMAGQPVTMTQATSCATPRPTATTADRSILIQAIYPDTLQTGVELAEAVRLINVAGEAIEIGGWQLSDNEGTVAFLPGTVLLPGQRVWIARDPGQFRREFGFAPDFIYEPVIPDPAIPWLLVITPNLELHNAGDEVVLLTPTGAVADAVVYGAGCLEQPGWADTTTVQPYRFNRAVPGNGAILYRKLDQRSGQPLPDSDTANDWAQATDDPVNGRKLLYPGWDLDDFFFPARATEPAVTTFLLAPDNAFDGIASALERAQRHIAIEAYLFTHPALADRVLTRMADGVTVTALFDGEVVGASGGTYDEVRWFAQEIVQHGGQAYFWKNRPAGLPDRYNNAHQKFILIDGEMAIVSTENFSQSALPNDDKGNGTAGNRGAAILTNHPTTVARLQAIFAADADPVNHDDLVAYTGPFTYTRPATDADRTGYTPIQPAPLTITGPTEIEVIQSPETSLRDVDSLLGLVGRAGPGDLVLVQQQYEDLNWGPATSPITNTRLAAYLAAARRGAAVFLLLDCVNDQDRSNLNTAIALNQIAAQEGLRLRSWRQGYCLPPYGTPPTGGPFHIKLVLVRAGREGYVHVSSINGSENSSKYNREIGLQVTSLAGFDYYAAAFNADWLASGGSGPITQFDPATLTLSAPVTLPFAAPGVITAQLLDGRGLPVADGITVTFQTSLGQITPLTHTAGGIATATLTSTVSGNALLVAATPWLSATTTVMISPPGHRYYLPAIVIEPTPPPPPSAGDTAISR